MENPKWTKMKGATRHGGNAKYDSFYEYLRRLVSPKKAHFDEAKPTPGDEQDNASGQHPIDDNDPFLP